MLVHLIRRHGNGRNLASKNTQWTEPIKKKKKEWFLMLKCYRFSSNIPWELSTEGRKLETDSNNKHNIFLKFRIMKNNTINFVLACKSNLLIKVDGPMRDQHDIKTRQNGLPWL